MARGNNKQSMFLSDRDRLDFLDILEKVVRKFSWVCLAYCLMGNHFHLLIQTPEANLSSGMQYLNGSYCLNFNRKHGRVGHVIQGRFQSRLVKDDSDLLNLYRYILLNPVKEGLASAPEGWRWSSYRATVGLAPNPPFLELGLTLSLFSSGSNNACYSFRNFILEGMQEVVSSRVSLDCALQDNLEARDRNVAIRTAYREHGYSIQEIADHLKVHRTTVFRALRQ